MSQFPWEVSEESMCELFKGPYLFAALYRDIEVRITDKDFNFMVDVQKLIRNFKTNLIDYLLR